MRPEQLPRAKKLAIALLTPINLRNNIRTIQPQIFETIKSSQSELKFTGSYKKECKNFVQLNILKKCFVLKHSYLFKSDTVSGEHLPSSKRRHAFRKNEICQFCDFLF